MQLLWHSPATQKIKTGHEFVNLRENYLYITFRIKTIQKYGIFLSYSPLIKSLQQSVSAKSAGEGVHFQPGLCKAEKRNIRPLVPCVSGAKGLSAQRYPHSTGNHSPPLLHFLDSNAQIFQNTERELFSISSQIYKIVKMQRDIGLICHYTQIQILITKSLGICF